MHKWNHNIIQVIFVQEKCDMFKYYFLRAQNVVIAGFLILITHYVPRKIKQKVHYSSLHFWIVITKKKSFSWTITKMSLITLVRYAIEIVRCDNLR
jgi:hypothetical protein